MAARESANGGNERGAICVWDAARVAPLDFHDFGVAEFEKFEEGRWFRREANLVWNLAVKSLCRDTIANR